MKVMHLHLEIFALLPLSVVKRKHNMSRQRRLSFHSHKCYCCFVNCVSLARNKMADSTFFRSSLSTKIPKSFCKSPPSHLISKVFILFMNSFCEHLLKVEKNS